MIYLFITVFVVAVGAISIILITHDHPWMGFFLALLILGSISVKER